MSVPSSTGGLPAGRDLPPDRAILVVDAKGFSEVPSARQPDLNAEIPQVLAAAFQRAGLTETWRSRRFPRHTGDGFIVGFPSEKLSHLIDPLLRELQAELEVRDHQRPHREPRLRLRVSVHVGPLPDEGLPNDGIGTPMNDTHRLLDSREVRRLLDEMDEDVTFVAAIVSRRAFDDAVRGGYTAMRPSQFDQVTARAKRFAEPAYLYVPKPSAARRREHDSAEASPGTGPDPRPAPPAAGSVSIAGKKVSTGDIAAGNIDKRVIINGPVPSEMDGMLADLSHDDVVRRIRAARSLADEGFPQAVPQISRRLKRERDPEVLSHLVRALGSAGGEEARQALRTFAASALGQGQHMRAEIEDALRQARPVGRGSALLNRWGGSR